VRTLFGEYFSPWSEKARWALDHRGVAYVYREHVPLLGEPLLRFHARKLSGRVSVPLLVCDEGRVPDSFAIARYAERVGNGVSLFPDGDEAAITMWNTRSEVALRAARACYLGRVGARRAAKIEMQPTFLPNVIRRASVPAADLAIGFLRRKYADTMPAGDSAEQGLVRELERLRRVLRGRGGDTLVGDEFTFADVAMAVTLQFVVPVQPPYMPLGPATRQACFSPEVAAQFGDLVAWRDRVYERWR
jgi:glutathione S-transferase